MGFILDGLETESYDREYRDRDLVRRILEYFLQHGRAIGVVVLALTVNSVAGAGAPIAISRAIDAVGVDPSLRTIAVGGAVVFGMGGLAWLANFVQQGLSARVTGDVVLRLREEVLEATVLHDLSFFDTHPSGKIVSRTTSDTQDFSDIVSLVVSLFSQALLLVILVAWLFTVNPVLTLQLVAMAPVAAALALSFRRVARRVTQHARRVTATINAQIQESISGIGVAKAFRKERTIYETFERNNRLAYRVGLRRGLTLVTIFPLIGISTGLGMALLVVTGGLRVQAGLLTPGNWYLFMQAVFFFWWPMMSIASFWSQFQDGLSAAERVFALIDAEPNVRQTGSLAVPRLAGRIEFRSVQFGYAQAGHVLPDFSLTIEPGESVALVGHTGAGKSSIARLIARFYEFQGGELRIDGHDLRSLDLAGYRQQLGIVPQDPFLFAATVGENIHYSRPEATDTEVRAAARQISGGDWLADLPAGLETNAGERGANLSMGQRQLVALARVLLKDPAILILDEATASVDPFTEIQIQEGLRELLRGRTSVVIAHRLWTVQNADRILVLDHGRILQEGTHNQLLSAGGHYALLYDTFFRHQSLEYVEALGSRAQLTR
jgi:ABC-type multidrug transport system fused ATPase/permease subunit